MRFLDTSRIRTRFDERVRAADGAEMSVDLYLPPEPGRYPVVLNRTPADNNRAGRPGISSAPAERWKALAAQGFIVAAADVRGRGDSDGQFKPFVNEGDDGAATIAWLRGLEECNGKIGLFGSGYGAFCAWAAAVTDGHVDAVVSISPFGAPGEGLVHRGGAVRLDWLFWMHLIGGRSVQPPNAPPWKAIYRHWPLLTMDDALGRSDIAWREWLEHLDQRDPFWRSLHLTDEIAGLDVPALHVTGWWDGQAAAAHYYFQAACRSRGPQQLIVGPWDTAAIRHRALEIGGFDFGPRSVLDLDELIAEFFKDVLSADGPGMCPTNQAQRIDAHRIDARRTGVQVFVTGRNEWINAPGWPPVSRGTLTLYLSSTSGANTRRGDGQLSIGPLIGQGADAVTQNPDVPVDYQPLFVSFAAGANPLGFTLDQAHVTSRDEALVYTADPLMETVTVMGYPTVTLTVRTPAADADLHVLLSDTFPLGTRDLHLSHSTLRLATLRAFKPGAPTTVQLTLDPIAHDFLPGHHIRLTVTASLFPLYARNPQVAGYVTACEPAIATIELLHGPDCPAALTLPLAEGLRAVARWFGSH